MTRLQSIEEIRSLVADVRNKRKGFITNFYLDEFKHNVWIQKGDFFYEVMGYTLFFVRKSDSFCNLFYSSISVDALCDALKIFEEKYPKQIAMMDIVGRESQCKQVIDALGQVKFSEATSLVRMSRFTEPMKYVKDTSVTLASPSELKEIYDLLHQFFDEKTEQIPYYEELQEYVELGHILVCHEGEKLAGFLIYEMNATTLFLRYWFTHPDYRERKIGSRLLRRFFEDGKNTKRQLFWVIRSNENAIKRYRHYGFKEENMYDFIYTNMIKTYQKTKTGGGNYLISSTLSYYPITYIAA